MSIARRAEGKRCCLTCSACVPVSQTHGSCRAGPAASFVTGFTKPKIIGDVQHPAQPLMIAVWSSIDFESHLGLAGCRDGWKQSTIVSDVVGREEGLEEHFTDDEIRLVRQDFTRSLT